VWYGLCYNGEQTTVVVKWFDRETIEDAVYRSVRYADSVLDIGCGIRPQTFFQPKLHICCEPHAGYVRVLQNRFAGHPGALILQSTWEAVVALLPNHSVDTIFLIDVIEHLDRLEGRRLLEECERIARKQIIVFTPLGFMEQEMGPSGIDAWGLDGGQWQVHKSGWTPDDFDASWEILASRMYHTTSASGESLEHPFGAFWAIKNIGERAYIAAPVRFAVLSHILPPAPSGQAVALSRVLRDLRPEDYCLVSTEDYDAFSRLQNTTSRLPARYYQLPGRWRSRTPSLPGVRLVQKLAYAAFALAQRSCTFIRVLERERSQAVIACTGSLLDLPVGYLASRWTRVPFYVYVFDDYVHQWIQPVRRFLAERIAPFLLRGAKAVIVPNEFLRDEYRRRYGIEPVVIHNPVDPVEASTAMPWPADTSEITIMYTGAIYQAHYDAFHNLLEAIDLLGRSEVRLHLYTAQPRDLLERMGITGPVVYHPHLPLASALEAQRRADILFLPLAFDSDYAEEIVRTSAPGKMGEYLASGRPILVHAPLDAYVSWYFRKHDAGQVVDQPDPHALAEAIQQIINEPNLRKEWCENAQQRARSDFSLKTAQSKFLEMLGAT